MNNIYGMIHTFDFLERKYYFKFIINDDDFQTLPYQNYSKYYFEAERKLIEIGCLDGSLVSNT